MGACCAATPEPENKPVPNTIDVAKDIAIDKVKEGAEEIKEIM